LPSISARIGFVALLFAVGLVVWLAQRSATELHRFRSEDPTVWEAEIEAFERQSRESPPEADEVVFIGASAVRFWDSIVQDMAPLWVVGRGFGGAKLGDVLHYADRLVAPRPGAVVLAVGGNDLFEVGGNKARAPEEVAADAQRLFARLLELIPGVPIYYVAIRPPILDPEGRDPSSRANAQIREAAEATPGVEFIDANGGMYGPDGRLREGFRAWDRSQLTAEGYRAWAQPIRERLLRELGPV
jgi:lysophospholipase L1-like esterase